MDIVASSQSPPFLGFLARPCTITRNGSLERSGPFPLAGSTLHKKCYHVIQLKGRAFEKVLLPEHQSNDIETCFVSFLICPIKFRDLSGFNRSFFLWIWEIICRNSLWESCKNNGKQRAKFPFIFPPNNNETCMCSCILSPRENRIPLNKLFILGGTPFIPT